MNVIDLIIIAVITFGAVRGYRRGFLKTLSGLIGYVLAFAAAAAYSPKFASWLNEKFQVTESLSESLREKFPEAVSSDEGLNGVQESLVEAIPIPEIYQMEVIRYLDEAVVNAQGTISDTAFYFASILTQILAFALIFFCSPFPYPFYCGNLY